MCWLVHHGILMQLREQSTEIDSLFHHVSSGDRTKVICLDNKCLHWLSHPTGPHVLYDRIWSRHNLTVGL